MQIIDRNATEFTFTADSAASARSHLFARMVQIALPQMQDYLSDLFHDAHFLDGWKGEKDVVFHYIIRTNGTHTWVVSENGGRVFKPWYERTMVGYRQTWRMAIHRNDVTGQWEVEGSLLFAADLEEVTI